jgi:hypothetical protein
MAAFAQMSRPHPIAVGLRYKAAAIAALLATAVVPLTRVAPGAAGLRRPSPITNSFIRQPPTVNVNAVTPEAPARSACVLVLGEKGKFSVGPDERSADTFVSLVACDLYNASRAAQSTELLGGASLSARNIFLSGGYALSAGSVMTASRYLTTHTAPPPIPISASSRRLMPDAREPVIGWASVGSKPYRRASIAGGSR